MTVFVWEAGYGGRVFFVSGRQDTVAVFVWEARYGGRVFCFSEARSRVCVGRQRPRHPPEAVRVGPANYFVADELKRLVRLVSEMTSELFDFFWLKL